MTSSVESGPMIPLQGGPQTIIVNYPLKTPYRDSFKSTPSLIAGIVLILSGIGAVVVQSAGFYIQHTRFQEWGSYHKIADAFYSMSGIWTCPLIFLAGSFAIVSSKTKRVGFIITSLVMSILSAMFAVAVFFSAAWAVFQENSHIKVIDDSIDYLVQGDDSRPPAFVELMDDMKQGLEVGVVLFLLGLMEFTCAIYLSTLCCVAVCCDRRSAFCTDTSQVMFLNNLPAQNTTCTSTEGQTLMTQSSNLGQQSGCEEQDMPPSYSDQEIPQSGTEGEQHVFTSEKMPLTEKSLAINRTDGH